MSDETHCTNHRHPMLNCPECASARRESSFAATAGSEAKPKTISEWFRYLTETGNFNAYQCDGSAKCKEIEAGFAAWKAAQGEKSKPLNAATEPSRQ